MVQLLKVHGSQNAFFILDQTQLTNPLTDEEIVSFTQQITDAQNGVLGGADSPYVYVMDVADTVFGGHSGHDLSGIDTLRGPVKHQTQAVFEYAPGGNEYQQGNCNADQRVNYIPACEPYCNS